ncbi:MAG: hypothetical protein D8M54_03550 [Chloroflexi bacterium]|nr:hypothetical protein [Chloroflexota bacterium]
MGFNEWYDGWDDLKEPSPYLLHIHHSRRDAGNSSVRIFMGMVWPFLIVVDRQMALPEPLDALPDLILMLDHNTDNAWLDAGKLSLAEGGDYPP